MLVFVCVTLGISSWTGLFIVTEARTHGVAYYEFSTDEAERARQQEELKNLRKETENQQAATLAAAQKKQRLMEERLKAARRRKRERLGLPLDEEEPEGECFVTLVVLVYSFQPV